MLYSIALYNSFITINILYDQRRFTIHPSHPMGGHPPHSNLVRGKLTSPTPTLQETGPTVLRPIREDEVKYEAFDTTDPSSMCNIYELINCLAHFRISVA